MGANQLKVLVGSKNPTKTNAVKGAFERVFKNKKIDIKGKGVGSGVSDQPMSDIETKQGAKNRLKELKKGEADYYVSIEGGCDYISGKLFAFAWVITENKKKMKGTGKLSLIHI